jgi:hypothetical protein
MKAMIDEIRQHGTVYDREAAIALRAIEQGARDARKTAGGEATAYLTLMGRLLQVSQAAPKSALGGPDPRPPSPIVLP